MSSFFYSLSTVGFLNSLSFFTHFYQVTFKKRQAFYWHEFLQLICKLNYMAKATTTANTAAIDKKTHMGYNEKNPVQPEGPFKADSMETKPTTPKKGKKFPTTKKNIIK